MVALTTLEGAWLRSARGQPIEWAPLLTGRIAAWGTCAIWVPPLYWLAARFPVDSTGWRVALPIHVGASLAASLGKYALYLPLLAVIEPHRAADWAALARSGFLGEVMFYWAMIGLVHALVFHDRQAAQADSARSAPAPRTEPAPPPFEAADWIAAQGNYVLVHTGGRTRLLRHTIGSLEATLPPHFLRVHRSAIVNLEKVERVLPGARGTWRFVLPGNRVVTSARAYAERLRPVLDRLGRT
jgi:hypothetical protein